MCFPNDLEKIILEFTDFDEMKLATYINHVKKLSDYFITGRFEKDYFSNRDNLDSYLLFYFPQNYCKVNKLFSLVDRLMGFKSDSISILDFGAGPGNSIIGAYDYLRSRIRSIYYYEVQKSAINIFKSLFRDYLAGVDVRINDEPEEKIDIFIFSYVIPELEGKIFNILGRVQKYESEDATYIFLSPPTKLTLRLYSKIREKFEKRGFNTIYPCRAKRCPVLRLTKEKEALCFSQFYWKIPWIVDKINSKLYFRIKYLKSSVLVLSKNSLKEEYIFPISPSIVRKGKTEVYFCTQNGREVFELLRRDESDKNYLFKEIVRGVPVVIKPIPSGRLSKNSVVEIL